MGKLKENPDEEIHTVVELCHNLFTLQLEMSEFMRILFTQERLDQLPQIVRLANEKRIIGIGLNPHIDSKFWELVVQEDSLNKILEEEVYYQALEGGIPAFLR